MVPRAGRIRSRPVSFGNPALGTYGGCVYTLEGPRDTMPVLKGSLPSGTSSVERLAVMVDVPPDQVPEGVLIFARSHRIFVRHVRIVIASLSSETQKISDGGSSFVDANKARIQADQLISPSNQVAQLIDESPLASFSPNYDLTTGLRSDDGRHSSAIESAASILASSDLSPSMDEKDGMIDTLARQDFFDTDYDDDDNDRLSRVYLVLFELCSHKATDDFVQDLNDKPYTILDETQRASVRHVVALQGHDGVSLMSPFFAPETQDLVLSHPESPSAGKVRPQSIGQSSREETTEVHNCAVCLDRMDMERVHDGEEHPRTALLTTVCNHSFHLDCLLQCKDSPCPVCRYDHAGLNDALSQCHVCGTTQNNYVCLICGVVSCGGGGPSVAGVAGYACAPANSDQRVAGAGRPANTPGGHALQHYDETLHAYALNIETQHVWDFAGQGYVHRLLQNFKDGKLVEVSDPNNTSHERSLSPGLSDSQEGEVVHRKLEGFASQYYTLLKSQLEQQRIYFEGRLQEIRREYGKGQHENRKKSASASSELITALKQERNQLMQRRTTLLQRYEKTSEEVSFLRNMNESLEANKAQVKSQVREAQLQRAEAREMIKKSLPPLEEKVTMLMLQLEESLDEGNQKPRARRSSGHRV